jgi:hypothetical protein
LTVPQSDATETSSPRHSTGILPLTSVVSFNIEPHREYNEKSRMLSMHAGGQIPGEENHLKRKTMSKTGMKSMNFQ